MVFDGEVLGVHRIARMGHVDGHFVFHPFGTEEPCGDLVQVEFGHQRQDLRPPQLAILQPQHQGLTIALAGRVERPQATVHTALPALTAATGRQGQLDQGARGHAVEGDH